MKVKVSKREMCRNGKLQNTETAVMHKMIFKNSSRENVYFCILYKISKENNHNGKSKSTRKMELTYRGACL